MTQIKTPDEVADERINENYADLQVSLDMSEVDADGVRAMIIQAIWNDRAQFFDTAGSASSQHFIDTGRYLLHEEVTEEGTPVIKCIHCGQPIEWVKDGDIEDWKHTATDNFGYSYFGCVGDPNDRTVYAEAPNGTPHP